MEFWIVQPSPTVTPSISTLLITLTLAPRRTLAPSTERFMLLRSPSSQASPTMHAAATVVLDPSTALGDTTLSYLDGFWPVRCRAVVGSATSRLTSPYVRTSHTREQ
eukprot:354212-Chlamydomonas_euryale.AAC.3